MIAIFLLISDFTAFIASFFAAYFIRNTFFPNPIQPLPIYFEALPFAAILLTLTFAYFKLYQPKTRITKISEIYTVIRANSLVLLLIMSASFLYKYDYSRGLIILLWITSTVFLILSRSIIQKIEKHLFSKGKLITRVVIIGHGHHADEIKKSLKKLEPRGYKIIKTLDPNNLNGLPHLINSQLISEVYFADPKIPHQSILNTIAACNQTNVSFKIISNLFGILTPDMNIYNLEGIPAINLQKSRPSIIYRFIKRSIDILVSSISLIVFAPFFLIIYVAIRLDSPGPALFSHKRIGLNGKPFTMHKFRTMKSDAHPQSFAPRNRRDRRITKVGHFLRRTSLDELPQIVNVLRGEMSLVGPRPEMPFIVADYNSWQRQRLIVKPGITGLWQILGRKDLPLHENLEYDIYYINNQSLLLDFIIIFKTFGAVIAGRGAF